MEALEVIAVTDTLDAAGIRTGMTGGWGIDALLRRQTRPHGDVDLGLEAADVDEAIRALAALGYMVVLDERPARLVLQADRGRVDLHPIVWDRYGRGVQTGLDGDAFVYPPGSLDTGGEIAGRPVRCATPELQLTFHEHYDPRAQDRQDMSALAEAFDLRLPAAYADPP